MKKKKKPEVYVEQEETSTKNNIFHSVKDSISEVLSGPNEEQNVTLDIRKLAIAFAAFVIILVLMAVIYNVFFNNVYNSYEVAENTDVENATVIDYVPYQHSLLKYSKDGAVYVDDKDKVVWNETYAMKMPAADVCGDYIAIADLNGTEVYVFDKEGKVSSTTMPYPIRDLAVAGQGAYAVVLEGEKENYVNMYDKNGEQIVEMQTSLDKSGYPLDVDLSEDGEKLVSSYMNVGSGNIFNRIACYNFGVVGQNSDANRMMGAYELTDTVVPSVEFVDNNTICAFGDNQILTYSMKEKPSEKATITLKQEVLSVAFNSSKICVITANDENDGNEPYIMKVYNINGNEELSKKLDFEYHNVRMTEDEIIFSGGTDARILTVSGKTKFVGEFQRDVRDLIPTSSSRKYIVLYESGSEVITLTYESEKEKS